MGIGIGIVLLALGLILVLGVVDLPAEVDEVIATNALGWIFLVVGALAIILALVMNHQRSRVTHVAERRYSDPL